MHKTDNRMYLNRRTGHRDEEYITREGGRRESIIPSADGRGHGGCSLLHRHQSLSESELLQSEIVTLQRWDRWGESGADATDGHALRRFSSDQLRESASLEVLQLELSGRTVSPSQRARFSQIIEQALSFSRLVEASQVCGVFMPRHAHEYNILRNISREFSLNLAHVSQISHKWGDILYPKGQRSASLWHGQVLQILSLRWLQSILHSLARNTLNTFY